MPHLMHSGDVAGDRYEVIKYLGEGGMQQAFRANDLVLQREVALKTPKNASAEKRFEQSAVLSARVNHPHVAKTLDYFEDKGRAYLVEELIEGQDLYEAVVQKSYAVDPYLASRIFHYLAKGIAASHHVGVIHRDLKPNNVLVSGNFNLSVVKVTDFGIAKMAEGEIAGAVAGGAGSISGSATMVGALPYMAPEVIQNPKDIMPAADIWSLGAMMYEVISGKKPFGEHLVAVPNILKAELPPVPIYISTNNQMKTLGLEVYAVLERCLQKDPNRRPSADEIVKLCEALCYSTASRYIGVVREIKYSRWGFIQEPSGVDVFFHLESVYGPQPKVGSQVCYSKFHGGKAWRAHPVIVLKESAP